MFNNLDAFNFLWLKNPLPSESKISVLNGHYWPSGRSCPKCGQWLSISCSQSLLHAWITQGTLKKVMDAWVSALEVLIWLLWGAVWASGFLTAPLQLRRNPLAQREWIHCLGTRLPAPPAPPWAAAPSCVFRQLWLIHLIAWWWRALGCAVIIH